MNLWRLTADEWEDLVNIVAHLIVRTCKYRKTDMYEYKSMGKGVSKEGRH